ncbi:MAG: hypothetical protein ABI415_05825 [Flavitalea sp.]
MVLHRNIVFTGTVDNMTAYFSKSGQCIIRAKSSITGARIAKDPAFEGFRQSAVRMKDASPIASELYKQVPKNKKDFKLYRTLTGEALKMLKQKVSKKAIIENLQKFYINPLLNKRTRISKRKRIRQHSECVVKMWNRAEGKVDHYKSSISYKEFRKVIPAQSHNKPSVIPSSPKRIYMGRNKLYRKFKVWLVPTGDDDPGLYSGLYRHRIESAIKKSKRKAIEL